MKRLLTVAPIVLISIYMTVGGKYHFNPDLMKVVSPLLLALLAAAVAVNVRRGLSTSIDKTLLAYLLVASLGYWAWPKGLGMFMARFSSASLYGFLFVMAGARPLLGLEPFTTQFARRVAPEAVWKTDIFKNINRDLNRAWTAIFAACVVSALIVELSLVSQAFPNNMIFEVVLPLALLLGVGLPLTKWYPDHYQRKLGLAPLRAVQPNPRPAVVGSTPQIKEKTMGANKKVVAVNGSPHTGVGNTSQMIGMLGKTFAEEGFELEEIMLAKHHIEYCTGCAVCIEKGSCWIKDDHKKIMQKLLDADAIILASPVYFYQVTGQMKTFLDRSLGWGHRPLRTHKPGLSVSVAAAFGEVTVANYLGRLLHVYGAFQVGQLTALATGPGEYIGKDLVEARAADLARDTARAVRENRRYPATEHDLYYYKLIGGLVKDSKDFMKADYKYWEENGLYDSFEHFVGQERSQVSVDPEMRKAWLKELMRSQSARSKAGQEDGTAEEKPSLNTARELLENMPKAFRPDAANGLAATYQFVISGSEDFTAHIKIEDGKATYHDGPADNPGVTINTPADLWIAISKGQEDGAQAFMAGKYKVEGDLSLLMKLGSLFRR